MVKKIKSMLRFTLEPTAIEFRSTRKALLGAKVYITPGSILDMGCGSKPYKSLFEDATDYVGMDFPGADGGSGVIDTYASGLDCPFKNELFDNVLLIQVLEHTPEPARLLNEASRVLKKDGIIVATIPFVYSLHSEPYDFYRYTAYGIRYLFEKKFTVLSIEQKTGFFETAAQMLILHFWNPVKKIHNPLLYALCGLPMLVLVSLIQVGGIVLAPLSRDRTFTTGYCVVARKK